MSERSVINSLGYLGLLPFAFSLYLILMNLSFFGLGGFQMLITYSTVILSFLSGALWGQVLRANHRFSKGLLVVSNLFALLAWLCLIFGETNPIAALVCLIGGFTGLMATEYLGRRTVFEHSDQYYWMMRITLTGLVVVMHLVALIALVLV